MKPGAPWSIKGIDPEAREAAKIAAAKVGMTLGEYFNHLLLETSPAATLSGNEASVAASPRMSATSELPSAVGSGISSDISGIEERIQNSESRTAKDMSDIRQSVSQMSEQMSALVNREDETPDISTSALEDLNYRIEENQQRNEKSIADTQTTLSEISERIETSINRNNEAVTTVGKAIEVMAARIDTLEHKDDQPQETPDQSMPIDENMQFGSRHAPEDAEPELNDEPEQNAEAEVGLDEALTDENVEEASDDTEILENPEEALEQILEQEQSVDEVGPDTTSDGLMDISEMSADELLASFDDIPDLEDKPSEGEEAIQEDNEVRDEMPGEEFLSDSGDTSETEFSNQSDNDEPLEDALNEVTLNEYPEMAPSEPGRASSIDDFLNQFGDEPLVTKEPEISEEPQETQPEVEVVSESGHLPVLEEYVAEEVSDRDETDGKSAQDVIEAIRQAARTTSGIVDTNEDEGDNPEAASLAASAANSNSGSSRVKYAIYAACSAVLLAASGLIASVKGLI